MFRQSSACTLFLMGTLVLSMPVAAATQGKLAEGKGAVSRASARVSLVIPDMIRLSGVEDLRMQWDESANAFHASDRLCVYRNGAGVYSVRATGSEGAGFRMHGPDGSRVSYSVRWNGSDLASGERSTPQEGADDTAVDCGGASNAVLSVSASRDQVSGASSTGEHQDVLLLQVIAE